MYPNSEPVPVEAEQSTMPISPPSKRQERLAKGINYFSSKMFLVQLILALVFSVFEIGFGRRYFNQCPISPHIPLFLLVHGSTKIVWVTCGIIAFIEAKFFSNSPHIPILMLINLIIQLVFLLFLIIWFILGNVWVWSAKGKVQTTDSNVPSTYCQNNLFSAAQGLIISTYIVVGILTFLTIKRRIIGKKLSSNENN